jgi:hypothetical protein
LLPGFLGIGLVGVVATSRRLWLSTFWVKCGLEGESGILVSFERGRVVSDACLAHRWMLFCRMRSRLGLPWWSPARADVASRPIIRARVRKIENLHALFFDVQVHIESSYLQNDFTDSLLTNLVFT